MEPKFKSFYSGKLYFTVFKEGTSSYDYMNSHYRLLSSDESPLEGILDNGIIVVMECAQQHINKKDIEIYEIPEKYQSNPSSFAEDYMDGWVDIKLVWPEHGTYPEDDFRFWRFHHPEANEDKES